MIADNQTRFLRTVREALGHPGTLPRQAPSGLFPSVPSEASRQRIARIENRSSTQRRALIDTLQRAAEPIHLEVAVVDNRPAAAQAIARRVAAAPTEWGGPRQVCTWDDPLIDSLALASVLADHQIPVRSSASFGPSATGQVPGIQRTALRQAIIASFVGITTAEFCVADTATLVMRTRPSWPRSISLVPSIHIAVIPVDRVVADFKELYAVLRWGDPGQKADLTTCMTFISGPSKTADIEATLVHGAHGPRAVMLVVIDGD